LQRESQILDWAIQVNHLTPLFLTAIRQHKQHKIHFESDQAKALQHIAGSRDVITLIQGSAGV